MNNYSYIIIAIILVTIEVLYFRIAQHYNIIDKPNERSSHIHPTIRGGGVIFILSAFLFSVWNAFAYPYLMVALLLSGVVSFVDDIKNMPSWLRFGVHFVSGLLVLYQVGLFTLPVLYLSIILVLIIGVINAYNFMDGINGITGFYSLAIILPLLFTEQNLLLRELQLFVLISIVVFLFFNARKKARCFAGDVGSVGMAILVLFFLISRIATTGNYNYAGFLLLYGTDTVLTIIQRLYGRENIFKAHRKHLFQLLSNEFKMSHLMVSAIYGVLQLCVNILIVSKSDSPILLLVFILISGILYILIKVRSYQIIKERIVE